MSAVCPLCNTISVAGCDRCHRLYNQDIRDGRIPPQFKLAGEDLSYANWIRIRIAERDAAVAAPNAKSVLTAKTHTDMKIEMNKFIKDAADKAIAECLKEIRFRNLGKQSRGGSGNSQKQAASLTAQSRGTDAIAAEIRSRYTY